MNAPAKLAAFAGGLALLFGGGALAGGAVDPDREGADEAPTHAESGAHAAPKQDAAAPEAAHNTHGSGSKGSAAPKPVRGLAVAEGGLRLVLDDAELRGGVAETVRFRVETAKGATVRDFDVEHEKRMHLIIARRDLTGFQHLHPEQAGDGTWSARVQLDDAGSYRLFADFAVDETPTTLASDLRVDGDLDLRPLPAPSATAASDGGYDVKLDAGDVRAGREAELRFTITKAGHTVHTEPYLGAGGHLVALREGDLAFLHVHPTEHPESEGGADEHDDAVGFGATFPTVGSYRLFLQFKHEGRVQTVAFTQEVR